MFNSWQFVFKGKGILLGHVTASVGNLACLIPQERAAQQSVKSVVSV